METLELIERIGNGEDSFTQFKSNIKNITSLAYELMAFSNAEGGTLIIGVDDKTNDIIGLNDEDIHRLNQLLGNAIRDKVKPLIYPIVEIKLIDSKKILVIEVNKGINKPYDVDGVYYTKAGSDKRQVSQEELRRLFAESKKLFADEEIVNGTDIGDLNIHVFENYLKKFDASLFQEYENKDLDLKTLLQNSDIMRNDNLTIAGNLIFGKDPQKYNKSFYIDCCYFDGNDIDVTNYIDEKRVYGTFETLYEDSLRFLKANLQSRQQEEDFNSSGVLEIDEIVLSELIINTLIHRDYQINAPIQIFMFHNRIEIISPGKLFNSLTVEKIKLGNTIRRNQTLDRICNVVLPYTGRGSGIRRVIKINPEVEFINDTEKEQFICIIPRKLHEI
ncbi:RNA-binding domain-containing protein [Arcobacter peruensis]|uniref:RNA-binding domain-containing protein n=1 Tax=Arcobacter peruensis TaxID=2320140 RepID=UPI000F099388|nr:RNA-binding domain-containing protein [Arcobacter peruensis]